VTEHHALDWLLRLTLDPATVLYLLLIGVFVPVAATRTRARFAAMPGPAGPKFKKTAAQAQISFLILGIAVAWTHGIWTLPPPQAAWQWLWVLPAVALGETFRWVSWISMTVEQRRALWVRHILPTRAELPDWIALALLASFAEEITYRGLLFGILATATGSFALASVLCALSFGVAHAPQGARGQVLIGTLSLLLHAVVILTGSLLPAMAVHAIANIIAGVRAPKRFRALDSIPADLPQES
jgi:membrane protease YdiL (CAAX protease family)